MSPWESSSLSPALPGQALVSPGARSPALPASVRPPSWRKEVSSGFHGCYKKNQGFVSQDCSSRGCNAPACFSRKSTFRRQRAISPRTCERGRCSALMPPGGAEGAGMARTWLLFMSGPNRTLRRHRGTGDSEGSGPTLTSKATFNGDSRCFLSFM